MKSDWRPSADVDMLHARAKLLQDIREYFRLHPALEVDTPMLSRAAATDPNIHSMSLPAGGDSLLYLHTSPEFPMKRLLCAGIGDIYQICKVFRASESGRFHNPEFTLLEWYRTGLDHQALMIEVDSFLHEITPGELALPRSRFLTYKEALQNTIGKSLEELDAGVVRHELESRGLDIPRSMGVELDPWLDLLMSMVVAPAFDSDRFTFLYDYPASQAALAKISADNPNYAERFEVYFGELEIANGFHELQDAGEQLSRFQADNDKRKAVSSPEMPPDMHLIEALEYGLPDCAGVALGIDRLLMVYYGNSRIQEVLAFGHDRA